MKITAILFNAVKDGNRVGGIIYCDRKERFTDGELITTSSVIDIIPDKSVGAIVITKNSIYKVANWRN